MKNRYLALCGVIAPLLFTFMTILGGILRPGYSHISDTVSELMSPGSPNKPLLDTLYTLFAILIILFGIGLMNFIRSSGRSSSAGITGASLYIAMGVINVTTATIFPQDPWGSPPTFPGRMHMVMSGVISILTLFSMLLLGIWFNRAGIFPKFAIYSFINIWIIILTAVFFIANIGNPFMGLAERTTILASFPWTIILAYLMYKHDSNSSSVT